MRNTVLADFSRSELRLRHYLEIYADAELPEPPRASLTATEHRSLAARLETLRREHPHAALSLHRACELPR